MNRPQVNIHRHYTLLTLLNPVKIYLSPLVYSHTVHTLHYRNLIRLYQALLSTQGPWDYRAREARTKDYNYQSFPIGEEA